MAASMQDEETKENSVVFLERAFGNVLRAGEQAVPVAAILTLLGVIERSKATTMHGLDEELKAAVATLLAYCARDPETLGGRTAISVSSGCDLFLRHVTRQFLEFDDFEECKRQLVRRGENFAGRSRTSRERIATLGAPFIADGSTVLVHGRSRVVVALLRKAASTKKFSVVATESSGAGAATAQDLRDAAVGPSRGGTPVRVVPDAAVGYFMESVDLVLVGAEGVVENGGVLNKVGTLVVATCAKHLSKPVYVAAESYKFARLFPLHQRDLPDDPVHGPTIDYTPPHLIRLLFTDLGVLTPAAVSDELIRLYQ